MGGGGSSTGGGISEGGSGGLPGGSGIPGCCITRLSRMGADKSPTFPVAVATSLRFKSGLNEGFCDAPIVLGSSESFIRRVLPEFVSRLFIHGRFNLTEAVARRFVVSDRASHLTGEET
jgi:hypothetical protein